MVTWIWKFTNFLNISRNYKKCRLQEFKYYKVRVKQKISATAFLLVYVKFRKIRFPKSSDKPSNEN